MLPLLRCAGRSHPALRGFARPLPPPQAQGALRQRHPYHHRWLSGTPSSGAAAPGGARALKMSARAAKKLAKAQQYLLDEGYAERTADSIIATLEKTPGMSASVSMLRSMGKAGLHSLVVAVEEEVATLDAKHAGKAKVGIRVSTRPPRAACPSSSPTSTAAEPLRSIVTVHGTSRSLPACPFICGPASSAPPLISLRFGTEI